MAQSYNGPSAPPPISPLSSCPLCNITSGNSTSFPFGGPGPCGPVLQSALSAVTISTGGGAASFSSGADAVAANCSSRSDTLLLTALLHQGTLTCSRSAAGGAATIFINASNPLYGGLVPADATYVVGALDMRSLTQCGACGFTPCTTSPGQAMYCPANTPAAICPGGWYCPDATRRIICPSGSFCPPGSVEPIACRDVAAGSCPEGSSREVVWVPLLIAVLLLALLTYGKCAATSPTGLLWLRQLIGLPGPASGEGASPASPGEKGSAADVVALPSAPTVAASGAAVVPANIARGGLRIEFRDLKLVTGPTTRLDGVSGTVRPGRFTAIIGGSGAGKTSLMNVLLAREGATAGSVAFYPALAASVTGFSSAASASPVAGSTPTAAASVQPESTAEAAAAAPPVPASALRRVVGFVPQVDVMRRDMTVQQVLMHSARMRLPQNVAAAEAAARVDDVISVLDLERIRYTVIGGDGGGSGGSSGSAGGRRAGGCKTAVFSWFASIAACLQCRRTAAAAGSTTGAGAGASAGSGSGISPGERKLVNVGMELVSEPRLLCLDEPTTGVDASTAMRLARMVGSLCRSTGMTALAVLHQPRGEIYSLLDDIIVLVPGGRVAYAGSADGAVAYFASLGFACPHKANKTDFLLDVVSGAVPRRLHGQAGPLAAAEGGSSPTGPVSSEVAVFSAEPPSSKLPEWARSGPLLPQQFADLWELLGAAFTVTTAGNPGTANLRLSEMAAAAQSAATVSIPVATQPAAAAATADAGSAVPTQTGFFRQASLYAYREVLQRVKGAALIDLNSHLLGGIIVGIVTCAGPLLTLPIPTQYKLACPQGGEELCVRWLRQMAEPATFYWTMTLAAVSIPPAVRAFGSEKAVFYREAHAGARPLAYYVGKVIASVPYFAVAAFMFLAPMVAIAPWRGPVSALYIVCLAISLFAQALGSALALLFSDPDAATLVGVIISILANLFGGFVPLLGDGAVWAYTHWTARAILAAELDFGESLGSLFNPVVATEHRNPSFWADIGALVVFIIVTHACGYILLRLAVWRSVTGVGKRLCSCRK